MSDKKPLTVALHGMDERSRKIMMMFLQGPCRGTVIVIDDDDPDVDIFDGDMPASKKLLSEHLRAAREKPTIVLSLQDFNHEGVLQVRKPVKTDDMLAVLNEAKVQLADFARKKAEKQAVLATSEAEEDDESEPQPFKTYVLDRDERKKTSKHRTAMRFDEKGFQGYIGSLSDIDVNDPAQFANASYDPKDYFQGYIQSAFMVCHAKGQIMQLQSGWKPIMIFPHTHEVWLDADDPQLRAFAGIKLNQNSTSKMSISPVNAQTMGLGGSLDKFQSMDAFLWKLACWTSKGRYPRLIDYTQPVYLKCWPNFTRLLITPHALRIAALLMQGPRTLPNVAQVLDIKPQYVFVFASAACALGLMRQAKREADNLIQPPEVKATKGQGLLSRIMNKLRG
ncbi:hypothetical protein [Candidatus Methylomicrobium oryzae]|jgi:hypothetical protein|uniref:hypothetical protein n=1 Tax=Candidatus Methylomicrobium oryzae TaxID=2802053 RepID=UPI001921FD33|nr:hypothetical protein [Methylomicrobium sp. RS1]MBL1264490.1 hypothetical protein [Methylomicrobium sp. RS1]